MNGRETVFGGYPSELRWWGGSGQQQFVVVVFFFLVLFFFFVVCSKSNCFFPRFFFFLVAVAVAVAVATPHFLFFALLSFLPSASAIHCHLPTQEEEQQQIEHVYDV